ncbi:unnamed protein product [Amoebophrya sp. A120]|nr:unnamed protein product [Amoebophrya sp. A120]|eukprot:GSA120T00000750001.1
MVFGEGKAKQNAGWANLIGDKDIPSNSPWDFQLAQVLYKGLAMEYRFRKKKETPDMIAYYDQMQSLADSINMVRKQFSFFFQPDEIAECLPIRDALALQERLQAGSCGLKFDLEWYMKNGAHLLAGSWFAKKHVGRTSFQPFRIQEQMSDAILTEGPQLVWGIAPPGTGKTAVVPHLLNLFPDHTLVFICAALPVVLGVGQVATSLGLPYALVKNKRITPAFSCGRKLGHHVDVEDKRAVQSLRETVIQMNLERKANRLKMVKRKRAALDFKRMPRIWLVCDIMSSSWIIEQLDSRKTIMVIDEPPMGSDKVPSTPEDNPMAMNMVQAMLNPMYKTILMSATMPRSYQLPSIVDTFCKKFDADPKKCVRECFSTQLDRGVVLVRPSGRIAFPHELCETSAQLQALADRLPGDPLTLKAYTERALSQLLVRWRVLEACKVAPANWAPPQRPAERFKDLSQLKPETIREYAMDLLTSVAKTGDDRFAKEFCAITLSEEFSGEVKETEQEAAQFPSYDVSELLFSNAHAFPGVTLVADDKPADILEVMAAKLIEQMPKAKDLDNAVEEMDAETKKQNKIAEKQQSDDPQVEFFSNDSQQIKFDSSLVLHTEQFLKRWCPKAKKETLMYPRMVPTVGDYKTIQTLPVDDKWKMLALSGAGAFDPVLDKDPAQPVYTQFVHDKMLTNKLSCVTAGKEFTWGANLPASTVVVTSSFANSTSVSGMLQYVGRAARRGLTTHGQALFEDDDALNRILKKGAQQMSTEADTMERYAKWILGDRTAESWGAAGTDIA